MKKQTKQSVKIIILGLAIGLGVFVASAITPPATTPGTVGYSLLNQESENQVKVGSLGVKSFLVSDYDASFVKKLKIGVPYFSLGGPTSYVLNVGYGLDLTTLAEVKTGGSEVTKEMSVSTLYSADKELCVDDSGTLIICPDAPVTCGTTNGSGPLTIKPTNNLCSDGSLPVVSSVINPSPNDPQYTNSVASWKWTCGTNSCSASQPAVCGSMSTGPRRRSELNGASASQLCSNSLYPFNYINSGSPSPNYWWTCGTGVCHVTPIIDGRCSTSAANTCDDGYASNKTTTTAYYWWDCVGTTSNGGTTATACKYAR